jgi:phosphohistidine phosphatase
LRVVPRDGVIAPRQIYAYNFRFRSFCLKFLPNPFLTFPLRHQNQEQEKLCERTAMTKDFELYIMRHGIAEDRGAGVPDDASRALTPEGKEKMREIAAGLDRIEVKLNWVVSSPLVRAHQTARIVAETLSSKPPLELCAALEPGGSPEKLAAFLSQHPERRSVMVVGHEPDLGELAARLIGAGRSAIMPFKKGGCCLITFADFPIKSQGRLMWWITPAILRKLG